MKNISIRRFAETKKLQHLKLVHVLLCFLGLAWGEAAFAQSAAVGWEWAAQAGGGSTDAGACVAADAAGNMCVVGCFCTSASVGTNVITSEPGDCSFFVAQYDCQGRVLWVQPASLDGTAYDFRLALDQAGNVYLTGKFRGFLAYGIDILECYGDAEAVFIAKFDRDGQVLWVRQADGLSPDNESSYDAAVDAQGNVYVTSSFRDPAHIGSQVLTSRGLHDMFLAKWDPAGEVLWVQQAGGTETDVGAALAVDAAGNVYLTGSFSGTAQFGETNLTSGGGRDMFLAKYDPNGLLRWACAGGGVDRDIGYHLGTDAEGNVYVAGTFRNYAEFGPEVVSGIGLEDIFLVKYAAAGSVLWARSSQESGAVFCQDLRLDAEGNVFLTGYFSDRVTFDTNTIYSGTGSDLFLVKYDPDGNAAWAASGGSDSESDYSGCLGLDARGRVYLVGTFNGSATFGTNQVTNPGLSSLFVVQYDQAGNVLWVQQADALNSGYLICTDAAVDPAGGVHVVGYFSEGAAFGTNVFSSRGQSDMFVANLGSGLTAPEIFVQPRSLTNHVGTTARFTVMAAGAAPLAFQWSKDGEDLADGSRVSGADTPSLSLRQVESGDAGAFRVTVSNSFGAVTSAVAVLTIDPQPLPPSILVQPMGRTVSQGDPVRFEAVIAGSEPLEFQWQWNGTNVPGATSLALVFPRVWLKDAGSYALVVSNSAGVAISSNAVLTVLETVNLTEALDDYGLVWRARNWFGQSRVTHDGVDAAECRGLSMEDSAYLETIVTGPGIISFRWKVSCGEDASLGFAMNYLGGLAWIEGETDWQRRSFEVPPGRQTLVWSYSRSEGAEGGQNAGWIDEVSFGTNVPPLSIVTQPRSQSVAAGDDLVFTVQAEGLEPFTYQWQREGVDLPEANQRELILSDVDASQAGTYTVTITSHDEDTITSAPAVLTVTPPVAEWNWASQISGPSDDYVSGLALDEGGFFYITGAFAYYAFFGTNELIGNDSQLASFLARYDPSGNPVWAKPMGEGIFYSEPQMVVNAAGDLYIASRFEGLVTLGEQTFSAACALLLAKYDRAGNLLWVLPGPETDPDFPPRLALDHGGNLYLAAAFNGGFTNVLGTNILDNTGMGGFFVARIDPDGNVLWVRQSERGSMIFKGLAVDAGDDAYVMGDASGINEFGGFTLNSYGYSDIFLAKLDSTGNVLWAKHAGGAGENNGWKLALDASGNAYVGGRIQGPTAQFDDVQLTCENGCLFVAKYGPLGDVLWVRQVDGYSEYCHLAVDPAGNGWLASGFYGTRIIGTNTLTNTGGEDIFLAKYDPDGNVLWVRSVGGPNYASVRGLELDQAGNLYLAGTGSGLVWFGPYVVSPPNPSELFVAKYDGTGQILWVRHAGSTNGGIRMYYWVVDAMGNVLVTGTFIQPTTFGPYNLMPLGSYNFFLARVGAAPSARLSIAPSSLCLTNGGFRLQFVNPDNRSPIVIEASSDLVHWEPVFTNAAPTGSGEFFEQVTRPARFYRAVAP